ncbi:MAG: 23S rRNA (uracil(1939)-C(5))-methyltransferase RlmD [Peptostreptococcaceae bacterium]|nr:23S rRNA (uracil(1939)-C(5))-methyltransferase RlmD [Peptostreptococcaceae bacterium]
MVLKENTIYEIEIVDIGHKGEAIGKYEGFTVFVDGAIKGDIVRAKISKSKKNYAVGELIEIIRPSADRVEPRCALTGICGGCTMMNLDYKKQLELKQSIILENLIRIGKQEHPNLRPIIGMDDPYNYRNKAQFPVGLDEQGEVEIGFYKKRSHDIIAFDECHIQHPSNTKILDIIKAFVKENKISVYDEMTGKGALRKIVTRVAYQTGEIMVVLVTSDAKNYGLDELAEQLHHTDPNIKSVIQNINDSRGNAVLGKENKVLFGKEKIVDYLHDFRFEISPHSFYQVNPVQTDVMYSKALEYAGLTGDETVFDLYCGIGTISLFLSQKAKKVYGIEIVPQAIEDAKRNAQISEVENAEFIVGKAEIEVPKLYKQGIRADVIVVDPPRKGIEEIVLQTIADMQVPRIVYVSCNPSTMARDIDILTRFGYQMRECTGIDNFCHSMHVECVCYLTGSEDSKYKNC